MVAWRDLITIQGVVCLYLALGLGINVDGAACESFDSEPILIVMADFGLAYGLFSGFQIRSRIDSIDRFFRVGGIRM